MRKLISFLFIFIFLNLLTSCTYDDMKDKSVPNEETRFAEEYLNKLRAKDFDYVKSKMTAETLAQANDTLLLKMSNYFYKGKLLSTEIINSQVNTFNGELRGNLSFEYHFSDGWNLASTAFKKVDGKYQVLALNVAQTSSSQKELNKFTLKNKSYPQYLYLLLAIIVPVFIVITTYFCIRTPISERKWLWVFFVLIGIFSIQVNWTTGATNIQLLSAHLLGISVTSSSPYAAWVISISFPLGAIMYWFKRDKFLAR